MGTTSARRVGLVTMLSFVLAICLVLVGCGGSGSGTTTDNSKTFIGTWEVVSMVSDGETTSEDDMATLKALGLSVKMSLSADKTCSLDMMGSVTSGTWEAKSADTVAVTFEGTTSEGKLADGKLTLEADGDKLVFSKTSDTPTTTSATEAETEKATAETTENTATETPIGTVIADDSVCTITVVSSGTDFTDDPGYNIKVTNNTDRAIFVTNETGTFSVNGKMVEPLLAITVQPGMYGEDFMYFPSSDVGGGVEALVAVKGTVVCYDDSTYETLGSYEFSQ